MVSLPRVYIINQFLHNIETFSLNSLLLDEFNGLPVQVPLLKHVLGAFSCFIPRPHASGQKLENHE